MKQHFAGRHFTPGELMERSAARIRETERFLYSHNQPMLFFLIRESSQLASLSIKFWFRVRWQKIKYNFTRK